MAGANWRALTYGALQRAQRTVASGGIDGTARVWDVHDPRSPAPIGEPMAGDAAVVTKVAFTPDGRWLVVGYGNGLARLWDLRRLDNPLLVGGPVAVHEGAVWSIAFAPRIRLLASGGRDRKVRLWRIRPEIV